MRSHHPLQDAWRWVHFGVADGLPSTRILDLCCTREGVFVVTDAGPAFYDGIRWTEVPFPQGADGRVSLLRATIAADDSGTVWIQSSDDLYRGTTLGFVRVEDPLGALCASGGGTVAFLSGWRATDRPPRRVHFVRAGAVERTVDVAATTPLRKSLGRTRSRSGAAWCVTQNAIWRVGETVRSFPGDGFDWLDITGLAEGETGHAILSVVHPVSARGIWEFSPDGTAKKVVDLSGFPGTALDVAPGGDALVTGSGPTLVREGGVWKRLDTIPEPLREPALVRYAPDGDLWVATATGLYLHRANSDRWARWFADPPESPLNRINEILLARDGRIWLGTGGGIEVRRADGAIEAVPECPFETVPDVTALGEDSRGRIWAGSGGAFSGLFCFDGESWSRVRETGDGVPIGLVHRICPDRRGRLWFLSLARDVRAAGAWEGHVLVQDGGSIRLFEPAEALAPCRFYDFEEGADGSLWFATIRGVHRYSDGAWRHWTAADGLPSSRVYCLAIDDEGRVYLGNDSAGLFSIEPDGTLADRNDLLVERHLNSQIQSLRYRGGRLWIATAYGLGCLVRGRLSVLSPSAGLDNPRVWPVLIDGTRLYAGSSGGGTYVLDMTELEFDQTQVGLRAVVQDPDSVSFSWSIATEQGRVPDELILTRASLDGGAWSRWSPDRELRFEGIGPGAHELRLQAAGPLDLEPVDAAAVRFSIPPPLHRNPWFVVPLGVLSVAGLLLWLRVVTHRRRLRRTELSLDAAMDCASDAVVISGRGGEILEVNRRFTEILGYEPADLAGRRVSDLIAPDCLASRPPVGDDLEPGATAVVERAVVHRDGRTVVPFEIGMRALPDGRIYGIWRDLRDRREQEERRRLMEQRLADAQRAESLAVLAGGVAHDFNNILAAILGNAEQALRGTSENDAATEHLARVMSGARRAADLTQQLLAYAGRGSVVRQPLDLNALLWEIAALLRATVEKGIALRLDPDPDLPAIHADRGRIQQVLVNLIVNASEAIGRGPGEIVVETRRIGPGDARLAELLPGRDAPSGKWVRLSVRDTGPGMDDETRKRAFEPFFTTRFAGRGLGLAAVKGVAESHDGAVHIESAPKRGTTISAYFPAIDEPAPPADALDDDWSAEGSVMVVDDEETVREVVAAGVRRIGFEPVALASAREALVAFGADPASYRCAIVDLTMPGMTGVELVEELRRMRPDLSVLLMSGYSREAMPEWFEGDVRSGFLQKPFTVGDLRAALRRILDGRNEKAAVRRR